MTREIREFLESLGDGPLRHIEALVNIESGSHDKEGVDRVGAYLARELELIGFTVEKRPQAVIGDQVLARRRFHGQGRVLILGHLDTVWPRGTLADWPFAVTDDGFAVGPGVGDMKGGLVAALTALQALTAVGAADHLESITFMLVPDEEMGTPISRTWIEDEADRSDWALVMEPGRENGGVVTQRGVMGRFKLTARGVSAHCAVNKGEGASAIRELAVKVAPLEDLSVIDRGLLVNVGLFSGGEARQVIPAKAELEIDYRSPSQAEADRLAENIRRLALARENPKVTLELEGRQSRPEFPRSPGVLDLYRRARAIAAQLGLPLPEIHTKGGSDGSFTAARGTPTLDGLGPIALDDCSRRERLVINSILPRTLLLAELIAGLGRPQKEKTDGSWPGSEEIT
ncbi:MAG: M20 family metallopeptidase [Pseudomonadota bacterium]